MAQITIQQAFELALQHHQAGRLREAEQLYGQILAQQPQHVDALHNLGVIAYRSGRYELAAELIRRALVLKPNGAEGYSNLGNVLKAQGQLEEAMIAYRKAIALKPSYAEAHSNLGNALKDKGQLDAAIAAYHQAIALRPNAPEVYTNLGTALRIKGEIDEAIAACRQAIALGPNLPEAYSNLGNALRDKGQLDEAIIVCRQAVILRPNFPEGLSNLGNALKDKGEFDEAINVYRQAIALKSNYPEAHINLANALIAKGQFDDAIIACRQAMVFNPNLPEAYTNLGSAQRGKGQFDEAVATYRQAIALNPDLAEAHNNLSLALLLLREWEEGWREYEWRWEIRRFPPLHRGFTQPLWDGSDLNGRTILLYAEQGYGDTIQFIRYLPLVIERGGRVLVETQPKLIRLLRQLPGVEQWIPRGESLPAFDVQCPLLSLPRLFETTLQTIPAQKPLLFPDPDLAQAWQRRLEQQPPGLKVGLVWAGNPKNDNDRNRSIPFSLLAPLSTAAGIQFYSLQKGEAAKQAATPPVDMRMVDWTDELNDFGDTAALVAQMDLIISADTSVAHLAGAMGKPVWLLIPFIPDWRWMWDRDDSPWYPTMRLFRQTSFSDWPGVIGRVVEALVALGS